MLRRTFLSLILAVFALFAVPARQARASHDSGILYWVVVDGKNPFVFGVKKESELRGFKRVRPGRYYDPVEARAACGIS
jgi:hypothetical protein